MSSLLRSTKFVRYLTVAARALVLNTTKTAEVNSLINPIALGAANNVLLRDYATSSKKIDNLEPLLQRLDLEVRRFGRVTKKDIDELFDEIQSTTNITSLQSLLIIRCCGELVPEELPENRTQLVQKIWNTLTERGIPMDISHYNALLKVYLENEYTFSPAKFLEELEKKGLQPNRVTYQRIMWRYCQEGDVNGATKVLEKMRELNMPVSEPVLNALVMGYAFHGHIDEAKTVLETMAGAGLQPSNHTYTLLACGYAKNGNIEAIQNVIKTAAEKESFLTDKDILEVIEHLAVGGHADKVENLFPHLQKDLGYNQEVYNLILRLLNKGQEETAKKVMKTMSKSNNIEDTAMKGAFFVKQLVKLNKSPEYIIKACKDLKEEGLVPNALYIATESALQQGLTELAQELFKELKNEGLEIRQHYYWPLLVQKGKEGDEEGLLQIVRNMVNEGVLPTGEALRDYIIPYLIEKDTPENVIVKLQIANLPVIHSVRNLTMELLDRGKIKEAASIALQYRLRGYYASLRQPLVNALGKTKDVNSFVTILHVMNSSPQIQSQSVSQNDEDTNEYTKDDNSHVSEIGKIVKNAVKSLSSPKLSETLLHKLYSKGLRIDTESAEAIEAHIGKNMTTKLSELLSQLTSSDLELAPIERISIPQSAAQLEQLVAQAKSNGNNSVNRLQKQLLLAYLKENNIEKLDTYIKDLETSGFKFDITTIMALFEFYCQNDDIEKANEYLAKLSNNNPEFVLNKFKSVHYAYALIRNGKYDEAIQFLKDNKPRDDDDDKGGFLYNSKCWQILNYLAEAKDEIKVKEMVKILIDNNYVVPTNSLLGPLIKVYMLKEDVEGALQEFESCCKNYRCTPWNGELMKTLITKEDSTKLQWLADLSTQIHGEMNTLHDLMLAFVECGCLRQARRILETPGLRGSQFRLELACERYVERGNSEYLEGLLEATRELSYIDRSKIFYHLLVSYCKADETDKALGLWTLLQDEGEVPSNEFLAYLGNHLKLKNKEIPFVIPADSNVVKPSESAVVTNKRVTTTKSPLNLTQDEVSETIENMLKQSDPTEAAKYAINAMEKGVTPKTTILKFLLKNLAEAGHVEEIQQLGQHIKNDTMKRKITYDNKLVLAIFTKEGGAQHVDYLLKSVKEANTDEELEVALRKFPRSNALASIIENNDVVDKCRKVAEIAASKGQILSANILWMEYLLANKFQEADSLWNQCLKNANFIVFGRLLQEAHKRNDPKLIYKLIDTLKSNENIPKNNLGNAYSRLINLYVMSNKIEDAVAEFENALQSGITREELNENSIKKLKAAIEATGKQFNF